MRLRLSAVEKWKGIYHIRCRLESIRSIGFSMCKLYKKGELHDVSITVRMKCAWTLNYVCMDLFQVLSDCRAIDKGTGNDGEVVPLPES